jgi:hypothetical protein
VPGLQMPKGAAPYRERYNAPRQMGISRRSWARPTSMMMLKLKGLALIAELIAAAWLAVAVAGLAVRRTRPWLICLVVAAVALLTSVAMIIEASSLA